MHTKLQLGRSQVTWKQGRDKYHSRTCVSIIPEQSFSMWQGWKKPTYKQLYLKYVPHWCKVDHICDTYKDWSKSAPTKDL